MILTELSGTEVEVSKLDKQERLKIVDKLAKIHSLRILHNDLRPANILVSRSNSNFEVRTIDFAMAKQELKGVLKREMRQLKYMLGVSD